MLEVDASANGMIRRWRVQSCWQSADTLDMSALEPTLTLSERRRSNRKDLAVQAYIASPTSTRKADRKEVTSVNISRHGVAFDFHEALANQTYWQLDVNMDVQKISCEICIVSCRAVEEGVYQIGAEFC